MASSSKSISMAAEFRMSKIASSIALVSEGRPPEACIE
jgi:hypothetical protein